MFTALSALVAGLCVAAALRELARAVTPTSYDPALLERALATRPAGAADESVRGLANRMATVAPDAWESALFEALLTGDPADSRARDARVNELLTELDGVTERGARVPGACARIALSSGFLFGTLGLLGASPPAVGTDSLMPILAPALNALAFGAAGTSFCVAIHARTRILRRRNRAAFDSLVTTLQSCNLSGSR